METMRGFQIILKPLIFDETYTLSYKSRISVSVCLARVEADTLSQEVPNIFVYFNVYKLFFLKTYSTDLEHSWCCPLKLNAWMISLLQGK